MYRLIKGTENPTLEEIEAVVRAYGYTLGDFFAPWQENERLQRQKLAIEIRMRMERILANENVNLAELISFLRLLDRAD